MLLVLRVFITVIYFLCCIIDTNIYNFTLSKQSTLSPVGRGHLRKRLYSDLSFEMILQGKTGFEQLEWREGKKQL